MLTQTTGLFFNNAGSQDGYVLFSPNTTTTTFLMDKAGNVVNQWNLQYVPGLISYLLPNGNLLRDDSPNQGGNGSITAAGAGGLLDEYDWSGNLVWQYAYDSPTYLAHHDLQVLPNGDVLLVAWQLKSQADATAAGRNPSLPGPGYLYPDSIVEIQPDIVHGTGTIVWQWQIWDHLVQDFDATKNNYYGPTGVQDHPELINLNYVSTANDGSGAPEDWTHCNGIDYNPQLDQIVLSSREFSEFWIIDHSTTTAEAASHSGGRSGHGGDLLYRYGNPQAYDRGTAADRVFYYQHDPKWIPAGSPGAGDITVFNNGVGRPNDQNYTSVDEITPPPVDSNGNYALTAGQAYGPSAPSWIYVAPAAYFSAIIGSATRLPNGDTLIDYGVKATFSEITPAGVEVWKYVSPYTGGGTLGPTTPIPSLGLPPPILSSLYANFTFQAIYYPTTILTPATLDLNGAAGGTSFSNTYDGVTPATVADAANATVSGPGATNLTQLTVAISGAHTGDLLAANNSVAPAIGVSFASGTLTLSGSDTLANYQAVLRTVKYSNTAGGPLVDTITINVQGKDSMNVVTNTATSTITLPPVLDLNGAVTGTGSTTNWFNSGAVGLVVPVDATAAAPAGLNLTSMKVVESSFHTGDVLAMTPISGISGLSSSFASGTLSITGSQTAANYQKILRLISYDNTSGGPGVSSFTASVTASDGTLTSTAVTATINATALSGQVLGNRLFYNNSKYDNNGAAIEGASDALAIASDKIGFNGTGSAGFNNVSSFSKGITGVMIDLQSGIGAHGSITLADITLRVSPLSVVLASYNNVATWSTAPTPSGFSVILGGGTGGSDRIEITWNTNDIRNRWLEVNVAAQPAGHTGLTLADVFFFGHNQGDSGLGNTSSALSTSNATDVSEVRANLSPPTGTPVWSPVDFDRNGVVNATDSSLANTGFNLRYIANPTNLAPSSGDSGSGDSGLSSGLAATSTSTSTTSGGTAPAWLVNRLTSAGDLNSGEIADYFRQLAAEDTADDRSLLVEADQAAQELGLNDDVLEGLLADLGLV